MCTICKGGMLRAHSYDNIGRQEMTCKILAECWCCNIYYYIRSKSITYTYDHDLNKSKSSSSPFLLYRKLLTNVQYLVRGKKGLLCEITAIHHHCMCSSVSECTNTHKLFVKIYFNQCIYFLSYLRNNN